MGSQSNLFSLILVQTLCFVQYYEHEPIQNEQLLLLYKIDSIYLNEFSYLQLNIKVSTCNTTKSNTHCVRSEVLTGVTIKSTVFWDV